MLDLLGEGTFGKVVECFDRLAHRTLYASQLTLTQQTPKSRRS